MKSARTYCNGPICRAVRSLQQEPANPEYSDNEDAEYYSEEEETVGEEGSDRYSSKSSDDEAIIFTPTSGDGSDVTGQNDIGESILADSEVESSGSEGDSESKAEDESEDDDDEQEDDDDEEREEDADDESEDDDSESEDDDNESEDDDNDDDDDDDEDDKEDDKSQAWPHSNPCMSTCLFINLENGSCKFHTRCVVVQTGSLLSIYESAPEPVLSEERELD